MPKGRPFGTIRKLPSGRYQVRYSGTDGVRRTAKDTAGRPLTFATLGEARGYLATRQADILRGEWRSPTPEAAPTTFGEYAAIWLAERDISQRTREHYDMLLRHHVLPTFAPAPVATIRPAAVRAWHAALGKSTGPTARAQSYGLLRTILNTAVTDELIDANPCRIRGAGQVKRAREIRPATIEELEAIMAALPPRYRAMVLLGAWCAMRFGEIAELRRSDVDLDAGTIRITRAVVRTKENSRTVKAPKTAAGRRVVHIPPHVVPALREHMNGLVTGRDGLLFPSANDPTKQVAHSALNRVFLRARAAAGRPDLPFHGLRHTGAVWAAQSGATLAELMARLGHTSPQAAMLYQHAGEDRDRRLALALSDLVDARRREPGA